MRSKPRCGAQMVALPEMFITGYQTQDLVMKPQFTADAMAAIEALALRCSEGPAMGIGGPFAEGGKLYNAYWILEGGRVTARLLNIICPMMMCSTRCACSRVARFLAPTGLALRIGSPVCEDAWHPEVSRRWPRRGGDPAHSERLALSA